MMDECGLGGFQEHVASTIDVGGGGIMVWSCYSGTKLLSSTQRKILILSMPRLSGQFYASNFVGTVWGEPFVSLSMNALQCTKQNPLRHC